MQLFAAATAIAVNASKTSNKLWVPEFYLQDMVDGLEPLHKLKRKLFFYMFFLMLVNFAIHLPGERKAQSFQKRTHVEYWETFPEKI